LHQFVELVVRLILRRVVTWSHHPRLSRRCRQDEIGTPLCVTVDFDPLEDSTVTIRDRDTTEQVRVPITSLLAEVGARLGF